MLTVNFKYLPMTPQSRILDMGCGSGRHTAAAYDHTNVHAIGVDLQTQTLQQARDRLYFHQTLNPDTTSRWSLAAADITRLPFKSQSFDGVICSEVLEHVPDHHQAARELLRVLKPTGHLVISVPRRWPEAVCWALSPPYRHSTDGHIRIYARNALIKLFQNQGATHWRTHHAHSLHTPFWWLKCLVGLNREHLLPVKLYHRFLTWDMMTKPRLTQHLDRCLNPLIGKSVVLYFRKSACNCRCD
jgi:ubiquinone/menaquinone biosynthesis C-methylase UbiE